LKSLKLLLRLTDYPVLPGQAFALYSRLTDDLTLTEQLILGRHCDVDIRILRTHDSCDLLKRYTVRTPS